MSSTMTRVTMEEEAAARAGAWRTIRRGIRLSPELRRGLPGTIALALAATAGKVIITSSSSRFSIRASPNRASTWASCSG